MTNKDALRDFLRLALRDLAKNDLEALGVDLRHAKGRLANLKALEENKDA